MVIKSLELVNALHDPLINSYHDPPGSRNTFGEWCREPTIQYVVGLNAQFDLGNRTSIADGNTWNHEHIATLGRSALSWLCSVDIT